MIKKYDVRLLTHDEYELYFSYMTEEKQRRILAMRSKNDRRRSVAADMLMRRSLSALTSLAERDIVISSEVSGRPAPAPLAALAGKAVRFDRCTTKDKMADAALELLL